jgi:ABC-type cobalamin transport system permease subunit
MVAYALQIEMMVLDMQFQSSNNMVWSVYFFYRMILTQAMEWMIMSLEGWACSFFMHSFEYVLRNCNMPAHALTALRVGGGLDSHNVWVTNLHPDAHFGCRRCRFAIMK